jgi:hypothetical protein
MKAIAVIRPRRELAKINEEVKRIPVKTRAKKAGTAPNEAGSTK